MKTSPSDEGLVTAERRERQEAARAASCRGTRLPRADLPDHAGSGDLEERAVPGDFELGRRVRLAEVPHGAVIDDIGATIGAKFDVCGAVEAALAVDERLLERGVVGKPHDLEDKRLAGRAE